jgi:hypothetical protein
VGGKHDPVFNFFSRDETKKNIFSAWKYRLSLYFNIEIMNLIEKIRCHLFLTGQFGFIAQKQGIDAWNGY